LCLFAPSYPSQLYAQTSNDLEIHWQGPPSCPRRAQFDAQLERLLSHANEERSRSVAQVEVVETEVEEFALRLTIEAPHGHSERVLTVVTCAQAQHAAALLIASAMDMADERAPASESEASRPELAARYQLRVGVLVDSGSLPAGSVGPSLGLGIATRVVRGWAEARYFIPRRARDTDSSLVADFDLFVGALGLARLWKVGPIALGPCVELEAGALRARAHGERDAHGQATLWLSSSAGAMLSYPRSGRRLAEVGLALLASIPWLRQPFALGAEAPFYTTGPTSVRAAIWLAFDVRSKS
jgi:hypothetical protein